MKPFIDMSTTVYRPINKIVVFHKMLSAPIIRKRLYCEFKMAADKGWNR